eukprot:TRINITY_DN30807_c0_g1_i1.p1 TRINITY_DN30807_c0_g1~~TRINITY_DN30807_c0_g1_i1.p1  ORF type:complete len:162 (-),score=5.40 TRINITY_DN30807_c0_g1_i1:118-540(-)
MASPPTVAGRRHASRGLLLAGLLAVALVISGRLESLFTCYPPSASSESTLRGARTSRYHLQRRAVESGDGSKTGGVPPPDRGLEGIEGEGQRTQFSTDMKIAAGLIGQGATFFVFVLIILLMLGGGVAPSWLFGTDGATM